jgi:hypothetical protein
VAAERRVRPLGPTRSKKPAPACAQVFADFILIEGSATRDAARPIRLRSGADFVNQFALCQHPVAELIARSAFAPQENLVCAIADLFLGYAEFLARPGLGWRSRGLARGGAGRSF